MTARRPSVASDTVTFLDKSVTPGAEDAPYSDPSPSATDGCGEAWIGRSWRGMDRAVVDRQTKIRRLVQPRRSGPGSREGASADRRGRAGRPLVATRRPSLGAARLDSMIAAVAFAALDLASRVTFGGH